MTNVSVVEPPATSDPPLYSGSGATSDNRTLTSFNPATGEPVGFVPLLGREGIEAAIVTAQDAQPAWASLSVAERATYLRALRREIVAEAEEIARLISAEQGKPVVEALSIELFPSATLLKYLEGEAPRLLAAQPVAPRQPLMGTKRNAYHYEPLGVVAIISPWNYPFAIPFGQIATALVAGNAVILKPSPFTPLVGQKIADLGRRAGLPTGVLQVIHLEDADAPALTAHPGIGKILFTGSLATGRKVMAAASTVPTPVVLELSGKDPALVCADADLARAVPGIVWSALANAGQTCASVERVYVERPIAEAFTRRVVEEVRRLRVGDPADPNVEVGALTNEQQIHIVEEQVADALAKGATLLVGGYRLQRPGYFYAPTVISDVDHSMRLMADETFGPVLPIMVCDSMDEAIGLANQSSYGLTASIWTRDMGKAQALAERIRAGAVIVNDHAAHWGEPTASWGGTGHSGFGRTRGPQGLLEMVNAKWISLDSRRGQLDPWWYPYNEGALHLLRNAIRFLFGPTERRAYALATLLLNPRTYQRVNILRFLASVRKWL
ncbi:MAG TPA: aldehyde dehydrogenase family protein [Ardenticatenaceae bacterium]|nr:aldehyde dehydrogenase family protein [Ardenticatenaceae bacterium]